MSASEPASAEAITAGEAFRAGLAEKRPAVALGALLFAALTLGALEFALRRGLVWAQLPEAIVLATEYDDSLHAARVVVRSRADSPAERVYVFGGSAIRESTDSAQLSRSLQESTQRDVRAYAVGSSAQSLAETLVLIDNLPRGPGLVAIGINHWRFLSGPKLAGQINAGHRSPLPGPSLAAALADAGQDPGVPLALRGAVVHLKRFLRRKGRQLLDGKLRETPWKQSRYEAEPLPLAKQREQVRLWLSDYEPQMLDNCAFNLALLPRLVARARQLGYRVVFLSQPLNRVAIGDELQRTWAAFEPACARLADELQVPQLDLRDDLDAPWHAFRDLTHLIDPEVCERWNRLLADALSAQLLAPR